MEDGGCRERSNQREEAEEVDETEKKEAATVSGNEWGRKGKGKEKEKAQGESERGREGKEHQQQVK